MQLVFQRRQRAGLTLLSSYTLAHAVVTNTAPWDVNGHRTVQFGLRHPHRVRLFGELRVAVLPLGDGVAAAVLGGWQVNAKYSGRAVCHSRSAMAPRAATLAAAIGRIRLRIRCCRGTTARWSDGSTRGLRGADDQHGWQHRARDDARAAAAPHRPLAVQGHSDVRDERGAAAGRDLNLTNTRVSPIRIRTSAPPALAASPAPAMRFRVRCSLP